MLTKITWRHFKTSNLLQIFTTLSGFPLGRENLENLEKWVLRYDTIGKIELIPSIVLSSDNTKYKNDIQLFLQLFDELSVYRDYH